ncbi:peptidase T [Phocicoccus pinnipedialis]|uniref:Peptidase T n=1 Tax=Phocicoccus pinnipedialis TaxID=110845 RepID=A0A6V7RA32_9BACL|nr:peptidase T [Jeotgalicoccus pinnipedialis]MBP1940170.1 tripeptide aminopeptidase [Jeotgalicoccus pinnipedialis]CAD2073834.1 Peptidase T [Jeotgalicoccus pinnipedialis]
MKEKLIERLTRYTTIDTQSDASSTSVPSTQKQFDLLNVLKEELQKIGLEDIILDDNGYLFATLRGQNKDAKTVGFLAHVDTATDFTGTNVKPQVVEYRGGDILLNKALGVSITESQFPALKNYVGHTLMTTDGTTLLGADNKAGIAEIITAVEHLKNNPADNIGDVRIAFTPDEEIGRGPHNFDVEKFGADFAYTVDGGPVGELQYESFNAAGVKVTVHGTNVHPGTAKDVMVNSGRIAAEFILQFDEKDTPEHTKGYEGFFHLLEINGTTEKTVLEYIIRDHDKEKFKVRKQQMVDAVKALQDKHTKAKIELEMEDQYYNMKDKIEPHMEIIEYAKKAMESLDIAPIIEPIRGGTDGSQLSYMGLPTPNIFTGGENFHGKYEFASIDDMEKSVKTIIEIIKRVGEDS